MQTIVVKNGGGLKIDTRITAAYKSEKEAFFIHDKQ